MKKKLSFLFLCLCCYAGLLHAQVTVKGIVLDEITGEPLIGAAIVDQNSKIASISDLEGNFTLKIPSYDSEIEISYLGYISRKIPVSADMGTIKMKTDEIVLGDVVVTSSVAIRRKTPVAMSVIEQEQIEFKLSNQEFPEILKSTPSVYVTKEGGGYGDARVNIRGFDAPNVAVMLNGVPMNDMEWGGVYWSNWAGLSDVTRSLQVQRGLGASKVSAPSVGGSINIQTKTTDAEKGGSLYYGLSNEGNKISFSFSTGLTENGWAISALGAKSEGNRYIVGTEYESHTYFLNVSKIINADHQLSFTGFGNVQTHNQRSRYDKLLISEWQKVRDEYKYNATYGFDASGQRKTANYNHYHKPQISLTHYWGMGEKSSLTTVAYLSLGYGGGYAWRGSYSDLYGADSSTGMLNTAYRTPDMYFDYGKLQQENAAAINGSRAVITDSRNNHTWVGLLSTYNTKFLDDKLDFTGGVDFRYYEGLHDAYIVDLMGGQFFIDPSRANVKASDNPIAGDPAYKNTKLKEGDIVYRDNTGYVTQGGVFGQFEYTLDKLNAFVSGSVSNNSYWKIDRFYYDNQKSDVGNFLGYTIKGGANYNLTESHNVFANIGSVSRAPFMSGGYFVNIHTSNDVNPDPINEKLFSAELGYGFRSKNFTANLNAYYTKWMNKTMVKQDARSQGYLNVEGIDALHQGIELELTYKPIQDLTLRGMLSLGDWTWLNDATGWAYNADGMAVDKNGNIVAPQSEEHQSMTLLLEDVKTGNSAQTTASLGASYRFLKDFTIGLEADYAADNYAYFNINPNPGAVVNYHTPWKIPERVLLDLNAQYRFKINGLNASLSGNINNLLDQVYIADATDLNATTTTPSDWTNVAVMYGFGRTYSIGLKVRF
jgi:Outer membrane receptor proteins, mostly Fe transport